ncbi:MAG: zinc-ribbon and DUF3426 domain-containing protein [Gammaproteobacteria bacterium]|nr:zinc-ribbon and DUF3426 domain-containing protein [Gammaproteobacteria bacterium]
MYTCCPYCQTCFGVSAAQLRAAEGQVRCGNCLAAFDGVANLTDIVPVPPATRTEGGGPAKFDAGETQFVHNRYAIDEAVKTAGAHAGEGDGPPVLGPRAKPSKEHVPEVLKEDIARQRSARHAGLRSALLTLAALALLAGLGLQFAWFEPARVLAAYPQSRPLLERYCDAANCQLPDRREPEKIQMLARDVRVHPKYEGALLVSATLINVASHGQPYPRMRFSVFNVNGQTIASRTFLPEEYLSPDVDASGEMLPGKPLQIAVELIAPEEAAVSFEIRFL